MFIAAIGSSAGGLEATEQFFRHLPADTGLAFILVPHLGSEHKGLLLELLQHYTEMKVVQAEDGTQVQPNGVYVIPPGKNMSILHGTLQILDIPAVNRIRMPIDFFFRHLADDQHEKAIGIILSGMGTDGSLGLKAIKENLGLAIAQEVRSAKFDAMPRSAVETGFIDYVLPPDEIPAKLVEYVRRSGQSPRQGAVLENKTSNALQKVCALLRAHTGNDFSCYKMNSVMRRIERRISVHQIEDITSYVRYLQDNPQELDLLFKELLIGVTSFFRDPQVFDALQKIAIPPLLREKARNDVFRAWVPGCSTGEEAYSLAIVLHECLESMNMNQHVKIQIFATDIDEAAIDKARRGSFPANIAADVSPQRLDRYFSEEGTGYQITSSIREMVVFAPQNLLTDPPFTRIDLLVCRNLLIYLTPETQQKLLPLFHYAVVPHGLLLLGSSETIGEYADLFEVVDATSKIYRRKAVTAVTGRVAIPSSPVGLRTPRAENVKPRGVTSLPELAQQLMVEHFAPPAVLITEKGDILFINGRTGKYLELPAGKANMNLFAMAREGLRLELGNAIYQAIAQQVEVIVKDVSVKTNGSYQSIDLIVRPVSKSEGPDGLLIVVFKDVESPRVPVRRRHSTKEAGGEQSGRMTELERELKATKEHLQSIIEQMDSSQEALQAANEELESTNEEIQSTNEELMTSREEMQSLNEELLTVNAELRTMNDELKHAYDDMKSVLNGTGIATIFLDGNLTIKRFTPSITQIVNLIQGDIGRPIADIALNLRCEDMTTDVTALLKTPVFSEVTVQTKDGQWYLMRVIPYRTTPTLIEGAVITFTNVTQLKKLERTLLEREELLKQSRDFATNIIATLREPFLVLDADIRIVTANQAFYDRFHTEPAETENQLLYSQGNGQWDIPELRRLIEEVLPKQTQFQDLRIEHDFPTIGHKIFALNARQLHGNQDSHSPPMILLAIEDVTPQLLLKPPG
jgi:two-component system CheB/CheR fusion protein